MDSNTTFKSAGPSQSKWEGLAKVNRALFDTCIRNAKACGDSGDFETSLRWCSVAAWSASDKGWFGALSSRELETELLRAARELPTPVEPPRSNAKPRWLHVLSEAYATLGHTNLCRRWIGYDQEVIHSAILLDQRNETPKNLVDAVKATGGECVALAPASPMMQRALELRNYAWTNADVVVLHTHPDEVLATVAFGVAGGPPVLVLNHADHVFWTGCAVADLVLDIRASGNSWTKHFRGVERTAHLPIPLRELEEQGTADAADGLGSREKELRKKFNIPAEATLLLTVGSGSKYKSLPGLSFVSAAQEIIRNTDNAHLLAVGPNDEGEWRQAKQATEGRIQAVGRQPDSTLFCRSADIYLEGFPAGSLTALLEAGQLGLTCVRAPGDTPPPFSSDGMAFDGLPQPKNVDAYIREAVSLAGNQKNQSEGGRDISKMIASHHTGKGWLAHLQAIKEQVPKRHGVYADFHQVDVDEVSRDWFLSFTHAGEARQPVGAVASALFSEAWKRSDAEPAIDFELWKELKAASGEPSDQAELARLNHAIRQNGNRKKLMEQARQAFKEGRYGLARKAIYQCALAVPGCVKSPEWLKFFVKAHIGAKLTSKWRQYRLGRAAK